jgi:hypothetical protein
VEAFSHGTPSLSACSQLTPPGAAYMISGIIRRREVSVNHYACFLPLMGKDQNPSSYSVESAHHKH